MNAQAILDKILEDAKETASATLRDANDRAAEMKKSTDAKIAAAREQMEKRAAQDAAAAADRMARMAELDERKLLLADKRKMMDRAFEMALQRLEAMPPKKARAFLLSTLAELAEGGEEIIVGADNDGWMDQSFLKDANAALVSAGKPGSLTLSGERRPGVSGLILAKNDTEIHVTWASLLGSRRLEMESQVAKTLFPD